MNTSFEMAEVPGWLWVVLIAAAAVQIAIEIWALVVLFRTPEERVLLGKRWIWVLIILFVNLVGAIVFLVVGRKPAEATDPLAQGPPATPAADRATRATDVLYGPAEGERQAAAPEVGGDEGHDEGEPR